GERYGALLSIGAREHEATGRVQSRRNDPSGAPVTQRDDPLHPRLGDDGFELPALTFGGENAVHAGPHVHRLGSAATVNRERAVAALRDRPRPFELRERADRERGFEREHASPALRLAAHEAEPGTDVQRHALARLGERLLPHPEDSSVAQADTSE